MKTKSLSYQVLRNVIISAFLSKLIFFPNLTFGSEPSSRVESLKELTSYESIVLAKSIKHDELFDYVVIDIIKGSLNVRMFNLLRASAGFASDNDDDLVLFYFTQNDFEPLRFGSVKIGKKHSIVWKGINSEFHLMDVYREMNLTDANHGFPKFLVGQTPDNKKIEP